MKNFEECLREQEWKLLILKREAWSYEQKSSKNHMKMRKSFIFVKKKFENKYLENK